MYYEKTFQTHNHLLQNSYFSFTTTMKASLSAAAKPSILRRRHLLKPPTPTTHLRHFTAEPENLTPNPDHPPPPSELQRSLEAQIVTQLKSTTDWTTNTNLHSLIFPSSSSSATAPLPSQSFLNIARGVGNSAAALNFLHFLRQNAPIPIEPNNLSTAFQAVLEHAVREQPNAHENLSKLLSMSKELEIPLTNSSIYLLIKVFGRTGEARKSISLYNDLNPELKTLRVQSRLLLVLLKADLNEDALQLLDEMLKPDCKTPPDDYVLAMVLRSFLYRNWKKGPIDEDKIAELVKKFGKHRVFPSTMQLTDLIKKFCISGNSGKAWELLKYVMKSGKVEANSCNALLSWLGRDREYKKLNLVLKEMKEMNIQPNVVTFSIFLNHLCKFRRVDEALEVFKKMKEGSDGICIKPDVIIYNTLIDGLCKVGRQEEGLALMEQMKSEENCLPSASTYNCLIDGFCKAGEIERAQELFDQMKKDQIEPNLITLNSLVDGMCKNGRVSSAVDFFKTMQENGLKPNAVTYTSLINAFCHANNIEKALKLFEEMIGCDCYPDAIVYYTLISGLTQAGRLDDASFIALKMKERGFSLDVVSYNMLIGAFCRKNRFEKAVEALEDMEKAGVKPDGITYNTLISYFSEKQDFETARKIMRQMIDNGLVPTVVTFGALIHAYCLAGDLDEAMKIFRDMGSSSRVPPNTVIYNTLIDSHCKNGKIEVAVSLLDEMKRKGVRPSTTTYNAVFKGLWDKNWLEKAYKLMDQMTKQGLNPDYITMEILTNWFSEVGQVDKLKTFLQGDQVSSSAAGTEV